MNLGIVGEAKILTYFIENGYKVFTPFDLHSPFDLIVYKDNILQRVSVKTTSRKSAKGSRWEVHIGQTCRSSTNGKTHKKFDPLSCDLLAIYIAPEHRIVIYEAKCINSTMVTYVPMLENLRAVKKVPLLDSVV